MMNIQGRIRADILTGAYNAGKNGAHLGSSLSIVEILLAIERCYHPDQDAFILSKGHGALGYYAFLHQSGRITDEQFSTFEVNGGDFPGQPSRSRENGILFSSGSLGMGMPYAVGAALAKRKDGGKVYVLLGDGELNEGSIWEAAMSASQQKLSNLVAIIDRNRLQSDGRTEDIINLSIAEAFRSFGFHVIECAGHNLHDLQNALLSNGGLKPTVIVADTIKGKGVSFMENDDEWHHHVLKKREYQEAMQQVEETYGD